jgi:hypothetical protein
MTPMSKEELARRWNEIVEEFERVDVEGWTIETNQYGQILMSPLPEGVHQYRGSIFAAYNQLVKAPEDRARLEKENPDLVAERDRIVTAQKRALLARSRRLAYR